MQLVEYCSSTGCKMLASHLASSWWEEPTMQDLRLEGKDVYLCSFDISSLFTKVPLKETIGICAEALYKDPSSTPPIPQAVFIELMESATSSVIRHPSLKVLRHPSYVICAGKSSSYSLYNCFGMIKACWHWIDCVSPYYLAIPLKRQNF